MSISTRAGNWWWPAVVIAGLAVAASALVIAAPAIRVDRGSTLWWLIAVPLHAPLVLIGVFLVGGMVERIGYLVLGRAPASAGRPPSLLPTVCVQLPMYNEIAVAQRVIEAAGAIEWPRSRLEIQVVDDSSDADACATVDAAAARLRAAGTACVVVRRTVRTGYKAGALEAARRLTAAEFIAIFDADFIPHPDYLVRTVPHFFDADGASRTDLALVQTRWGYLNGRQSALTAAQSLWIDDHHTLQMSWRSAAWSFVNFTGTAGLWRAATIEEVGGWRASSLVEDCELSFRHLFAGYRTAFVKEIVVPAEIPATYTAYKAQQRRWTQGWVQLQRLHLATLLFEYRTPILRRLHLTYHMCISWQWALWAVWLVALPILIRTGLWMGALGAVEGFFLYALPPFSGWWCSPRWPPGRPVVPMGSRSRRSPPSRDSLDSCRMC